MFQVEAPQLSSSLATKKPYVRRENMFGREDVAHVYHTASDMIFKHGLSKLYTFEEWDDGACRLIICGLWRIDADAKKALTTYKLDLKTGVFNQDSSLGFAGMPVIPLYPFAIIKGKRNMADTSILFFGDVHGHFEHVYDAVSLFAPKAIVFLGDVQPQVPFDEVLEPIAGKTDIWYIHGNHDTDSDEDYDRLFESGYKDRNLHGRVVEVAGVRIAGLGGVFRGQIWTPPAKANYESARHFANSCGKGNRWRDGLPRKHRSSIFPDEYMNLAKQRADILVTHEAPSVHPHGFAALDELARSMHVAKTFHGHQHDCRDYSAHFETIGFAAYGVGYCGVMDIDGETVLSGHHDHWHRTREEYLDCE